MKEAIMTAMSAWHLVKRPVGMPDPSCFELREVDLPELSEGQLLVRNSWLSVDPYMRGRMGGERGQDSYKLDRPMDGPALGEVIKSHAPGFEIGDVVTHFVGWRDLAIVPAAGVMKKVPCSGPPPEHYLTVLAVR